MPHYTEIQVYRHTVSHNREDLLVVKGNHRTGDKVTIEIGEESVEVSASDLIDAIKRAQ